MLKIRTAIAAVCIAALLWGCTAGQDASLPDTAEPAAPAPEIVAIERVENPSATLPAPEAPESDGSVTYTPVSGAARADSGSSPVVISGGCMEITVAGKAWTADLAAEEGASLRLILKDGAAYTGTVTGASIQDVYVSLDATSTWTLTGDVNVGGIVNADASFANIRSNGYAVQYDSEYADNAYLGGAAKQLPGGGFLTPII